MPHPSPLHRPFVAGLALFALVACAAPPRAVSGDGDRGARPARGEGASRLNVVPGDYEAPQIVATKSMPPQFTAVLKRQTPTPGYTLRQDEVRIDADHGRIVARVTEIAPGGMVAQVISDAELRLSLGTLPPGRYVLELHTRRGEDGEYRLQQALVLAAN